MNLLLKKVPLENIPSHFLNNVVYWNLADDMVTYQHWISLEFSHVFRSLFGQTLKENHLGLSGSIINPRPPL